MGTCKTSENAIGTRERERQALEYRRNGLSYEAIGKKLTVTRQAAHAMVSRVLKRLAAETDGKAAELRALSAERLDLATEKVIEKLQRGDTNAAYALVRIEERRAKLLGLDAPEKKEVTGPDGGPIPVSMTGAIEKVYGDPGKPEE